MLIKIYIININNKILLSSLLKIEFDYQHLKTFLDLGSLILFYPQPPNDRIYLILFILLFYSFI